MARRARRKPIKVIGTQRSKKAFDDLRKSATGPEVVAAQRKAAKACWKKILLEVPVHTGTLKKAIEYGSFKKRSKRKPAAFVRVDRQTAPHLHLVEFGTAMRYYEKKSTSLRASFGPAGSVRSVRGQKVRAKRGVMPKNPFFSRGRNKSRKTVRAILLNEYTLLFEAAGKRAGGKARQGGGAST